MSSPLSDYSSLFYLSPFPMWVYDLTTFEIIDVNQAAIDHYGYTSEEFAHLTLNDLRPKEEIPKFLEVHSKIEAEEGRFHFGVLTHQKKSGELIRVKVTGHKVDFSDKKCALVISQDVTEEERAVQAIKESEERLKTASSIAKLGYWRQGLNPYVLTWSDEIFKIWGRERATFEVSFENFFDSIHPEDKKRFEVEQKATFEGGKEFDFIHRIVLPDGSIKWVHELGRLVKNEAGIPEVFEGTVQDVTHQKEEELRLRLLESVITNTSDAVLITEAEPLGDPGPRIIYVNEAFTKMTGYSSEEVIGKTPRILQGPKSDPKQLAELGKAFRSWEPYEITTLNYKKNGEEFWNNFSVSPVANENGWYTHWIAIERDVTEKKNQELEQSLLAEISRIFNNEKKLTEATHKLCFAFADFGGFDFVEVWTPTLENSQLQLISNSQHSAEAIEFYRHSAAFRKLNLGEGIPGLVWNSKESIIWDTEACAENLPRTPAALLSGIKSILGIPLIFQEKLVGVMVFGSRKESDQLKRNLPIFRKLETFIGSEINRKSLEADLSHLFEAIPDIICLVDFEGRFLKMNKAGYELLGYDEAELLHHPIESFVHPEDRDISANAIDKLSLGETIFKFENRYLNKKGEIIWLSWTCNSEFEEGLIYASAKNITTEKKLRELNSQTSTLARIGSWELDVVDGKLFWNNTVHELHETDPETFIPDIFSGINFYREDFRDMVHQKIRSCIESGGTFNFEAVIITARNKERWVKAIGSGEFLDGKCIRVFGSFQDIHEKKESENRLQSLADNLPGVVFQYVVHPDGTDCMRYVSKGALEIWGFDAQTCIDDNNLVWEQIKAGGNLEEVRDSITESIKTRSKWTCKWKYILPKGELRIHAGQGTPEFLSDGTIIFNSLILDITEEKQIEKLLNQVSAMAKVGSWELDLTIQNEDKMYWSPMTRQILEVDEFYDPSLSKGFEFFAPESKVRMQEAVEKLIASGIEFDVEVLVKTAKGRDRWIRCIGRSERIHGKCRKIFGSFQDINQSKSLEIQNREILGSISDAFYALDKDWNFTYFNKEAENLLLKNAAEIIGKNIWDEFPAAVDTKLEEVYLRVAKFKKPESFEYLFPGDGHWYELNVYPSQGGISAYFKNIEERKRAEEQILRANERFEKVTEATNDAIWDWDIENNSFFRSKGIEKFFGMSSRKSLLEKDFWKDKFHPDDLPMIKQSIDTALANPEIIRWEQEYRIFKENGEIGDVVDKGVIIRNKKGKAMRMVGAMTDISDRKRHEEELLKLNDSLQKHAHELELSNEQLEQFAFIASHDLQEPLRMISSFLDQLKRKYGDKLDDKANQYIYFATDGAKRMKQIILDLLEFSRAGKFNDTLSEINLENLLKDYKSLRKKVIEEKSAVFQHPYLPTVEGYLAPFTQVIHCLLDNAIKYSRPEITPVIELSVAETQTEWIFKISDNGLGIDSKFFDKIFIIFQRLHNREQYEGSGIGLSIVKKQVESWGGKIWLESTPGEGSQFYFTLPKNTK